MNQTSGLPQKLPSVISTSAAPRSPDFNKANACSTLVTNVGGQKTNGLSTTKVPTSDHNLGGLQTRTTSTVQDNQGDLPILDAVEKESGTESTAVHDKILDSLPQLPSSVSECQSWNEMKSENLRLPTGPSSNAAEDADVSDQNVKNWILSHPNSDGYYEHCKFVAVCYICLVGFREISRSNLTNTVGDVF